MTKHDHTAAFEGALPLQQRLAQATANSFDADTREVTVVASTGASVRRRRYEGWDAVPYDEELVISAEAIDMARMNDGAAVLDSHDQWSGLASSLGTVQRAWVEGGQMLARIRLHAEGVSKGADAVAGMIRGGTAPKISLGYTLNKVRVIEAQKKGEIERWVVERWTPHELSFVTIPADAGAGVRNLDQTFPVIINRALPMQEEKTMDKTVETETELAARKADTDKAIQAAAAKAVAEDRERSSAIRSLGATHKLPDVMVTDAIAKGTDLAAFRSAALDHLATAQEKTTTVSSHGSNSGDDPAVRAAAMAQAATARILSRYGVKPEISEQARTFMEHGFADMAADVLGDTRRMSSAARRDEVLHRAFNTVSDFPGLLENIANKVLLNRYVAATPTYKFVAQNRNFSDFKATSMLRAGDFPQLLAVGETGEIKAGSVSESKETITLATYARQMRFSRNMLINDDLNAMGDVIASVGSRVADFENATFWAAFVANPALLTDGLAVFVAGHNNVAGAGTAITIAALSAARAAMMKQTSLDGLKLNIAPKYLVTSPDKQTEAEQIVTPITAQLAANVNPIGPKLTPLADANLTGNAWYTLADPAQAPIMSYGYLDGAVGPQTRVDEPFGVLGVAMQVVLDFGVGAIDYRGGYMNPGA